jgi:molybdopterin-guanine dinucleotide biosynthesis protein MobB
VASNPQHTPAVAFIGRSGSGKTTITEQVIERLSAHGHRVGSVKHHSRVGIDIDTPGKDSWRHRIAGSVHTVIASPDQLVQIHPLEHELEFTQIVELMDDVDVVIVEGYRHAGLPTIELYRAGNRREQERERRPFDPDQSVAVMTDMPELLEAARDVTLPSFDLADFDGITLFIEKSIMGCSR